jgi:rhodanese-related sulfurtransferase
MIWKIGAQALVLAAMAITIGLVHGRNSSDRERIQSLTASWKRTDVRELTTPGEGGTENTSKADNPSDAQPDTHPTEATDGTGESAAPDTIPSVDNGTEPTSIDLDSLGYEIGLDEALYLFNERLATFIDARDYKLYKEGHILDAIAIPYSMARTGEALPHVDMELIVPGVDRLVIYCRGGDCDESHLVAEELKLIGAGFTCHVFVDGYPAWSDAGHPTAEGSDPWLANLGAEPDG